jgi:hypothetical protein
MMLMMSINFSAEPWRGGERASEKEKKPESTKNFQQSALINVWRMSGIDAVVLSVEKGIRGGFFLPKRRKKNTQESLREKISDSRREDF